MTSAIVFSRNRAAQLDLLLSSIKANLPKRFFQHIDILWKASDKEYELAYKTCKKEWKAQSYKWGEGSVHFWDEQHFRYQVTDLICRGARSIMFFCDDDIVYRKFTGTNPDGFLLTQHDVLAVSMRLGRNTKVCYPLRSEQTVPEFDERKMRSAALNVWKWYEGDKDFGYPGSLDGHIFRRDQLHLLVDGEFSNPNTLEDVLVRNCRGRQPLLACYDKSYVVGNPVNRVNETHVGNRYGETYHLSEQQLNDLYLDGERLAPRIDPRTVTAAHQEIELATGVTA